MTRKEAAVGHSEVPRFEYDLNSWYESDQTERKALMDTGQMLRELRAERNRLAHVIEELEALNRGPHRRGRKSMGAEERLLVAARMRKYWANRRKIA